VIGLLLSLRINLDRMFHQPTSYEETLPKNLASGSNMILAAQQWWYCWSDGLLHVITHETLIQI
jgi:hypothetical protein